MALQSKLFSGDAKLEAAAILDPAHILPGASGPHVVKIQQALIQVAGAAITANGFYGPETAAAVADFKHSQKPPILNFAGKIDNIVGIKTMAALDAALPPSGSNLLLNFDLTTTLVDIVVNFIGAAGASPRDAEEALPQAFLIDAYDPVTDPLNRRLMRHKQNGKLLLRVAHGTNAFGRAGAPVLAKVLASIQTMLAGADPANGNLLVPDKIFILGSSSGGRNVLDFVPLLAPVGMTPHFVAPIDASFFQADTQDRPPDNPNRVLPVPNFKLSAAVGSFAGLVLNVPNRHNFFQSKGNHRGDSINPFADNFYTSDMAGGLEEIHGNIVDFTNHRVAVEGLFGTTDDAFHEECDAQGRRDVQLMIAAKLRSG
jgi:hypothetical protein